MTRDQFQKIEKILALDGYKNVVLFVNELIKQNNKQFEVIEELLRENEILHKRIVNKTCRQSKD